MGFLGHARMALFATACIALAMEGRASAICHGDCGKDGSISSADLQRIVSIINLCDGNPAGCAAVPGSDKQCMTADYDASGDITAAELTRIVKEEVIDQNPDCSGPAPLGTRVFTIAQSAPDFTPPSGFFSTGGGATGSEVTVLNSWYIGQPLKLAAGAVDPATGIAPLHLEEDAIFGWRTIQAGPVLCVKILAQGSTGQIDCDGGSAQDVLMTVDSNFSNPASPAVLTAHTGNPSRPGAVTLSVMATVDNIQGLPSPNDCVTHTFGAPSQFHFTTETGTALVNNAPNNTLTRFCSLDPTTACGTGNPPPCAAGKGTCTSVRLAKKGNPFLCDNWTTTDAVGPRYCQSGSSPGTTLCTADAQCPTPSPKCGDGLPRFETPLFGEGTQVGDTANMLQIGD